MHKSNNRASFGQNLYSSDQENVEAWVAGCLDSDDLVTTTTCLDKSATLMQEGVLAWSDNEYSYHNIYEPLHGGIYYRG